MNRRTAALVVGVGIVGSQAGHLLAYQLRFGAAAQQVQSAGAHAYFPALAKTFLGVAALLAIAALLVIGLARATGHRMEKGSAPPYLRLLAALFTIQLAFFALQETVEAATSAPVLVLWGTLGQLPVAAVAAIAVRWLVAGVGPALGTLRIHCPSAFQLVPFAATLVVWPLAAEPLASNASFFFGFNRRGPPSS